MKKFKAIFFLFTFCVSTLGYSFELHYCKGEITDISFIGHAKCVCIDSHKPAEVQEEMQCCEKSCHGNEKPVEADGDEQRSEKSCHSDEKGLAEKAQVHKKCCKTEQLSFFSPSVKALSTQYMPAFDLVIAATVFNPYIFHDFYAVAPKCQAEYPAPLPDRDITVLTRTFLI